MDTNNFHISKEQQIHQRAINAIFFKGDKTVKFCNSY